MVDQAPAAAPETSGKLQEFIDPGTISGRRFPPKGQPLITGFNRIGLWSLYMKEVRRFLKVQTQTVWAPAVTTLLFLVISGCPLGGNLRPEIVPGSMNSCSLPEVSGAAAGA